MLQEQAFWDFCYEHCNYFTDTTLATVLGSAGFTATATGVVFGRQYRWTEAESAASRTRPANSGQTLAARLQEYRRVSRRACRPFVSAFARSDKRVA